MAAGLKKLEQNIAVTNTVESLSSIFEIISTLNINHIRKSVLASETFYNSLQNNYLQLRTSKLAAGLPKRAFKHPGRVTLIITSAGSFSGPADEDIVNKFIDDQKSAQDDVIMVGSRGLRMLSSRNIKPIMAFDVPDTNKPLDVTSLSALINEYQEARAIYQSFESVSVQRIREINLIISSVSTDNLSASSLDLQLSKENHIFEPSFEEIIGYIESVILNITLSQIIYEAQLSAFANRFKYSTLINDQAKKSLRQLTMSYNRTRRQIKDEALREQVFQGMNQ